ncbi:MAG TPA: 16S rRNA (adenine(1518)-N(6)/adenine(1519)-N(6))-dimethyltransferase RsmA [Nitrososphaeraceae archaeon]|nr:16S rRNA (adenine(1518)-N(6)/adenine(1519)-N(6))-dimethyltransferase RsmA [Nitrososphaeraceae archaeon]
MRWSKTRSLGQHHLIDKRVLKEVIRSSQISREEVVCEAGTGEGILTRELCKYAKRVISFEIDRILYLQARNYLSDFTNLLLVHEDIFKNSDIEFDVFVSNLPYSRSKRAIEWLALKKFNRAIVMLQKEFVDKLQAKSGQANYRSISVIGQYCFKIENLFEVKKCSFTPQPKIDSEVIRLTPKRDDRLITETINNVHYIFSRRNKRASSVLRAFDRTASRYHDWNDKRIDQMTPEELVALARSMKEEQQE